MLTKAQIQRLRGLQEKKRREAEGVFVVENEKVALELLASDHPVLEVYALPEWKPAIDVGVPITRVGPDEMARISHFPTPSPVLVVGRLERPQLRPGLLREGLTLALDGVQDAGNVGTLIRIADWFGFARVLLSPDCADVYSQKVINASMGSFLRLPVYAVDLTEALRTAEVPVLGCALAGTPLSELLPQTDAVVVIGSEGRGLRPGTEAAVTRLVTIPKYGGAESLNAAVAAGIVCAQLRR